MVAHRAAAVLAANQPLQQRSVLVADVLAARVPVVAQEPLHPPEHLLVDNGLVLALEDVALVTHLAEVEDVGEQLVEDGFVELDPAAPCALERLVAFGLPPARPDGLGRGQDRAFVEIQLVDGPDGLRLGLIDDQPGAAAFAQKVVAQHRRTASPLALTAGGTHLIASAFRDNLPLELGKGKEDVQSQPAH